MVKKPSTPSDFRDLTGVLVTGPRTGLTVAIQALNPVDFIGLGIIPGMIDEATGLQLSEEERRKRTEEEIKKDQELQIRMIQRILCLGIISPQVLSVGSEIDDLDTQVLVTELGPDTDYYADEILILSGLKGRVKLGPFRRFLLRLLGRSRGAEVWSKAERTSQWERTGSSNRRSMRGGGTQEEAEAESRWQRNR